VIEEPSKGWLRFLGVDKVSLGVAMGVLSGGIGNVYINFNVIIVFV
jgi:hypothetical protein